MKLKITFIIGCLIFSTCIYSQEISNRSNEKKEYIMPLKTEDVYEIAKKIKFALVKSDSTIFEKITLNKETELKYFRKGEIKKISYPISEVSKNINEKGKSLKRLLTKLKENNIINDNIILKKVIIDYFDIEDNSLSIPDIQLQYSDFNKKFWIRLSNVLYLNNGKILFDDLKIYFGDLKSRP